MLSTSASSILRFVFSICPNAVISLKAVLKIPLRFNQVTTCSQSQETWDHEHLPRGVQTLQRAVVRVHDFTHLVIIAVGQVAAAKRDDAPAIAALGHGVLVLHERRPIARCEGARISGDAKAVVALCERPLFLVEP
jgi:hypothetical protein